MSSASAMGIAQAIQGIASAGGELTDISYKNQLDDEARKNAQAQAKARLDALNSRRQELMDANNATIGGVDLAAVRENMGPVGNAVYSSMPPVDVGGGVSLSDKLRLATSGLSGYAMPPQQNGPATVPPLTPAIAPVVGQSQDPVWKQRLDEIMSRPNPKVKRSVDRTNDFIAATIQTMGEQGYSPKDIKDMADAGGFTKDMAKMVADSGDKLTSEQNQSGMAYLSQTSQDARQQKMLDQQDELAGLQRVFREKLARMSEAGKNVRAKQMADAYKGQVAAINAISNADSRQQKIWLEAIEKAKKITDPNEKAALYNSVRLPYDADSSGGWLWTERVLKSVTPHPERVTSSLDKNQLQMQGHIGMLKSMIGASEDPNGDTYEDPDVQQVVLQSTAVDPRSTLPGANPKRSYVQP
jgi:hypothetical protein